MKADEQKPTIPVTTPTAAEPKGHDHAHDPHHPHHHHRPQPTVIDAVKGFFKSLQAAGLWNTKIAAGILAVVAIGGAWWFLSKANRDVASAEWRDLERTVAPTDIEKLSESSKGSVVGKIARLEYARNLFGPEGLAMLPFREGRTKGVANVEKARDEFLKLSSEFPNDKAIQGECLANAAEAELALVGVPKEGGTESRGSVDTAVDYYRKLAKSIGEKTAVGEKALKRAEELEKNKGRIREIGLAIANRLTPPPVPDIKTPPSLTPPIQTPTPPSTRPILPPILPTPTTKAPMPTVVPPPVPTKK